MACFSRRQAHVPLPVGRDRQAVAHAGLGVSEKRSRWAVWDVSGAGAALREGFQPGRFLGKGLRGVTLGMAPLILDLHLCLYSDLHPGELLGLAVGWWWGSSVGLAGVWGCGMEAQAEGGPDLCRHSWAVGGTGQHCGSGHCISLGHL